jgi:hypothetical protein
VICCRRWPPRLAAGWLAALLLAAAPAALHAQRVEEYRLKAAVIYNLAKFVDWPDEAFSDPAAPLVVCVLGNDPFGAALDETLKGHMIGRHAAVARRIGDVSPGCHVLFVATSEAKRLPAIVERLHDASVLTVGEMAAFTDQGGMIGLTTESEHVRFEVNLPAAERAHLKISARVMALAASVRRTSEREHKP